MYDEIVKRLRNCLSDTVEDCAGCPYQGGYKGTYCMNGLITEAADAIEELSKPRWIPVTEALPEKYHQVLFSVLSTNRGGLYALLSTKCQSIVLSLFLHPLPSSVLQLATPPDVYHTLATLPRRVSGWLWSSHS